MSKNLKVLSVSLAFCGLFSAQAFAQCSAPNITSLDNCTALNYTTPGQPVCQWNADTNCKIWGSNCELTTCKGDDCQLVVDTGKGKCVSASASTLKANKHP